jgi:hypothetical protein
MKNESKTKNSPELPHEINKSITKFKIWGTQMKKKKSEERRKRINQKSNKESIRIIQNLSYSYHKESKTIPNRQESRYRIDTNIQNLSYQDEEEEEEEEEEEDANGPHDQTKTRRR